MELLNIKLTNFLSFRELDHYFIKSPVLVQGKNLTEIENKQTNGSGKSTVIAGIAYAILATSLRKQTLDRDLITWGQDVAEVELNIFCPIRNQVLNIHRTLRVKGSASLKLTINDTENSVQFATLLDGNAFILNWIGISSEDLKNYFIINKENYKSFVSSSNTDKLALISRFIKADALEDIDETVKNHNHPLIEESDRINKDMNFINGQLAVYKKQLSEELERDLEAERSDSLRVLNERIDNILHTAEVMDLNIENAHLTISSYQKAIDENLGKISEINSQLSLIDKIDFEEKRFIISEKTNKLSDDYLNKKLELELVLSEEVKVSNVFSKIKSILDGGVECPKCSHKFSVSEPDYDLEKAPADIKKYQIDLNEYSKVIKGITSEIEKIKKAKAAFGVEQNGIDTEEFKHKKVLREIENSVFEFSSKVDKFTRMIGNVTEQIKGYENTIEKCNTEAEDILEDIKRVTDKVLQTKSNEIEGVIKITEKKLQNYQERIDKCNSVISNNSQWISRFKEFKMSLACEQLLIIQNYANASLDKMKSELRLSIDGYKVDSKGKVKSEVTVSVISGEGEYKSFWSYSGGERCRIEVALILAFQEMINCTNPYGGLHFLSIDEVLEGTDPLGMSLMVESMENINFPVYIISHVMNMRTGVKILTIVKENGYSYIEDNGK